MLHLESVELFEMLCQVREASLYYMYDWVW